MTGKIAGALGIVLTNALLARLLTPSEMGVYFISFSIVMLLAAIAQLGTSHVAVRFIAESIGTGDPGRARSTITRCVVLTMVGGVLVSVVWISWAGPWVAKIIGSPLLLGLIGITAAWALLYAGQSLIAEVFRGFHDIRSSVLFGGVVTSTFAVSALGVAWLWRGSVSLGTTLLIIVLSIFLNLLVAGTRLTGKIRHPGKPRAPVGLAGILSIAWPIWITTTVIQINRQADLWVLGTYAAEDQVAIYGAAARLAEVVFLPLMIVNSVVPPMIAEAYSLRRKGVLRLALQVAAGAATVPALTAVATFLLFGAGVLGILYGDFYAQGGMILLILSLGYLGNVISGSGGLTLLMTGHQLVMMLITVVSAGLLVAGAAAVAGAHGAFGVALVAASVNILQNALYMVMARLRTGVWTIADPVAFLAFARGWWRSRLS